MQTKKNFTLETTDHFDEAFQKFNDSGLFDRLQNKFRVKPYFEKYRTLKNIVFGSSFILNAFSACTAFMFVFVFLKALLPAIELALLFALIPLFILEAMKRKMIPPFFQDLLQFKKFSVRFLIAILLLSAASITSSYFGAKDVIKAFTPEAELTDIDSLKAPYLSRIEQLEQDKEFLKQQTWKGKVVRDANKQMTVIQKQIADQEARLLEVESEAASENKAKLTAHNMTKDLTAEHFALITLVLEILLIAALYYKEYYDFRSLSEFAEVIHSIDYSNEQSRKQTGFRTFSTNTNSQPDIRSAPERTPIGFRIPSADNVHRIDADRITVTVSEQQAATRTKQSGVEKVRNCAHCGELFDYQHWNAKYCSDACRIAAWEARTGRKLKKGKKRRRK